VAAVTEGAKFEPSDLAENAGEGCEQSIALGQGFEQLCAKRQRYRRSQQGAIDGHRPPAHKIGDTLHFGSRSAAQPLWVKFWWTILNKELFGGHLRRI
jgi:hypothetical protein